MQLAATELPSGFWSYVHKDNTAEHGRILNLCELIKDEFALLTGRELVLFTDRNDIGWGDKWRAAIDDALTETTFFIAIVTPRYIASAECRRELLLFSQAAQARGVPELLFPVIYIDVDDLNENSTDEIKAAIARAQYISFTKLRLADEDSSEYRTAVHGMAQRLIEIANTVAQRAEEATEAVAVELGEDATPDEGEEPPGLLEAVAAAEAIMPDWQATIQRLTELLNKIGELTQKYTPKMHEASEKGASAQIVVAHQYATELQPVADEFRSTGERYVDLTLSMNQSILAILKVTSDSLQAGEPLNESIGGFFMDVLGLVSAGEGSAASVEEFQRATRGVYGMSRAIRKPLETINEGAQHFVDAQAVLADWKRRIQELVGDEGLQADEDTGESSP